MRAWAWCGTAIAAAAYALSVVACGGGGSAQSSGTGGGGTGGGMPIGDGGPGDAATDGSGGAVPYPAPHPPIPKVVSGGKVMKAPKIVNVTFANDPLEADIDAFATAIGKTSYWGDVTKEYGVAPLTPIARVHDAYVPPAMLDDAQIRTWLVSRLDGTHPEYPAPDENTLYALYFPPGVTLTNVAYGLGPSCTTWHGYHDNTQLADNTLVAYAIVSRCDGIPEDPKAKGIQYVSAVASHEVVELITDPFVETSTPGYGMPDDDHTAWSFIGLAELGDMCALVGNAFYTPKDFPYLVQRIWSNAVAPTGHDPCLPEPAGQVYFNSAPVLEDKVSYDDQGFTGVTKGVKIPVGGTRTVEIDLFSEAPTPGPWNVKVKEIGGNNLDLSLDHSSGKNGDKLNLTIHVKTKGTMYGGELFVITSTLGTQKSLWVGLVGN